MNVLIVGALISHLIVIKFLHDTASETPKVGLYFVPRP
jgi:hypothetical protein